MISTYIPHLSRKAETNLLDVYRSGWFSRGKYNERVEERLKEKFGFKYALLVNTGTHAVHLCACVLKHFTTYVEIDVPDNVYTAAVSPFVREQYTLFNHTPSSETWCSELSGEHNVGLAVHNINSIVDVRNVKKKYTYVVEDCCESFGGKYGNHYVGTLADCGAFSFYINKNITCGEGGLFVTKHKEFYDYAKLIFAQGLSDTKFIHSVIGYNYRMTEFQAAILDAQLDDFDMIMQKKRELFSRYYDAFEEDRFILQKQSPDTTPSNWMFGLGIKGKFAKDLISRMQSNGVDARPMFCPLNRHGYTTKLEESQESLDLWRSIVIIPSYSDLKPHEVDYIIKTIQSIK